MPKKENGRGLKDMECKKCGAASPEGVTFCQICGARLDGKKECKHCGKYIDEGAVYCGYCGRRADGKTVCPECGAVVEGDFCPNCGVMANKEKPRRVPRTYGKNENLSSYGKVVKYLAPSLMLAAMVVLLVCGFFINARVLTDGKANEFFGSLSGGTHGTVFYFFGDCYSDLRFLYNNTIPASVLISYIFATFAVVLNFAAITATIMVSIVKFVKGVSKKESVNLTPFFGWAFGAFIFATCTICGTVGCSVYVFNATTSSPAAGSLKIVSNAAVLVGIILPILCASSAVILQAVAEGKKFLSYNRLGKVACFAVGLILAAIALSIAYENALKITLKSNSSGESLLTGLTASLPAWAVFVKEFVAGKSIVLDEGLYFFASLSYAVLAVAVSLYIAIVFCSLGKEKSCFGAGVLATVCTPAAIIHLIGAALVRRDFANVIFKEIEGVSFSIGGAVAVLVLSAFVVASSITAVVFSKKVARAEE